MKAAYLVISKSTHAGYIVIVVNEEITVLLLQEQSMNDYIALTIEITEAVRPNPMRFKNLPEGYTELFTGGFKWYNINELKYFTA